MWWNWPHTWQVCILGWNCRQQRSQICWRGRPCSPARESMQQDENIIGRDDFRNHHITPENNLISRFCKRLRAKVLSPRMSLRTSSWASQRWRGRGRWGWCTPGTRPATPAGGGAPSPGNDANNCGGMMITWMIVLRKTRVMISQNMNWDLQMYRTVRRFFRFHLRTCHQSTHSREHSTHSRDQSTHSREQQSWSKTHNDRIWLCLTFQIFWSCFAGMSQELRRGRRPRPSLNLDLLLLAPCSLKTVKNNCKTVFLGKGGEA